MLGPASWEESKGCFKMSSAKKSTAQSAKR